MIFALILLPSLALTSLSSCEPTDDVKTEIQYTQPSNSSIPPLLEATASKLIRYRSKPPVNFYRYKPKPQPHKRSRPRIKSPKIKHNRPMFPSVEPSSYYKHKPEIHTSSLSLKPSYTFDEIQYEVSSEYPNIESIPESSYETHSMDLDFYGETYTKKKTDPQYEYSKPQKVHSVARPQKSYGVPKEQSFNSYDFEYTSKPEVHYEVSYHEESPQEEYQPVAPTKTKYEDFPPYGAPPKPVHKTEQVSYQIPVTKYEEPLTSYHPQESPSKQVPFPTYEKKLPNSGYNFKHNFAEPPTDIHIIHSPSYDIEPLPPKHAPVQDTYGPPKQKYGPPKENYGPPPSDNYGPPKENYGPPPSDTYGPPKENYGPPKESYGPPKENYGPPPSDNYGPPNENYGVPEYNKKFSNNYHAPVDSYHQQSGGQFAEPPGSYLPPPHQAEDLPLNKNHMPPGYDYPKSSYEVPLYDPIPFESTTSEHDFFPPNHHVDESPQHEHISESSNHVQHISSTAAITTTTENHGNEQGQEANTKVHRFTPRKNRYKSRYQTTVKAPVSTEETEVPSSKYLDEMLSTTSTKKPRRKRKRTKAPVTEKHNLDVPELQEAFETGRESDELAAHASDIKESVEPQNSTPIQKITEFSPSHSWNPMRIRTKQTNAQRGQRLAETHTKNDKKNVEVFSIQKSRSHDYYAGTVPPSTKRTKTLSSRADTILKPTVAATTQRTENTLKPTRGLAIDTTYFKVKDNEDDDADDDDHDDDEDGEDFYDGTGQLPSNHKLF